MFKNKNKSTFEGLYDSPPEVPRGNCDLPDISEQHLQIYKSMTGIICSLYSRGIKSCELGYLFFLFLGLFVMRSGAAWHDVLWDLTALFL